MHSVTQHELTQRLWNINDVEAPIAQTRHPRYLTE
jgi:hypothetical protein